LLPPLSYHVSPFFIFSSPSLSLHPLSLSLSLFPCLPSRPSICFLSSLSLSLSLSLPFYYHPLFSLFSIPLSLPLLSDYYFSSVQSLTPVSCLGFDKVEYLHGKLLQLQVCPYWSYKVMVLYCTY
jgi:hypothetical protein